VHTHKHRHTDTHTLGRKEAEDTELSGEGDISKGSSYRDAERRVSLSLCLKLEHRSCAEQHYLLHLTPSDVTGVQRLTKAFS
jgi:hypothetical protein